MGLNFKESQRRQFSKPSREKSSFGREGGRRGKINPGLVATVCVFSNERLFFTTVSSSYCTVSSTRKKYHSSDFGHKWFYTQIVIIVLLPALE